MGRVDNMARVLRTPATSIDDVVARAMAALFNDPRPADDPDVVIERIGELQKSLETHKRAYALAEAVYRKRLRICDHAVHELRALNERMADAIREAAALVVEPLQGDGEDTRLRKDHVLRLLREVVPNV